MKNIKLTDTQLKMIKARVAKYDLTNPSYFNSSLRDTAPISLNHKWEPVGARMLFAKDM